MAYRVSAAHHAVLIAAVLSLAFLHQPASAQKDCSALWRLYRYWQSSDGASTDAALNMTLQNTGDVPWAAGEHNFTYTNPNVIGASNSTGFNATTINNGTLSGVFTLASALPPNGTVALTSVLEGTGPENFRPYEVTVDSVECRSQQV